MERRPCSDIFDQESSVVLSALLTSKRAGRIVEADRTIFLRDCNAEEHIAVGRSSRCVFDRLSDLRSLGVSTFGTSIDVERSAKVRDKKTSSKESFSSRDLELDRRNERHSRKCPGRSGNNATYESMKRIIDRIKDECNGISGRHVFGVISPCGRKHD